MSLMANRCGPTLVKLYSQVIRQQKVDHLVAEVEDSFVRIRKESFEGIFSNLFELEVVQRLIEELRRGGFYLQRLFRLKRFSTEKKFRRTFSRESSGSRISSSSRGPENFVRRSSLCPELLWKELCHDFW